MAEKAVVKTVFEDSVAYDAGIEEGDIIKTVNGKDCKTARTAKRQRRQNDKRLPVLITGSLLPGLISIS